MSAMGRKRTVVGSGNQLANGNRVSSPLGTTVSKLCLQPKANCVNPAFLPKAFYRCCTGRLAADVVLTRRAIFRSRDAIIPRMCWFIVARCNTM